MNPRIGWDGKRADIDRWLASLPERPKALALEKALADRIPDEWWTAERSLWAGLDFSWMADLQRFDHWDVEKNSPWPAIGAALWPNGFPLFFDMTPWVKLRLARGVAERHVGEAATEVEHLAALLLSTETLVGAAMALQ